MSYLKCNIILTLCNLPYLTPFQIWSTCDCVSANVSPNYIVDSSEQEYIYVS